MGLYCPKDLIALAVDHVIRRIGWNMSSNRAHAHLDMAASYHEAAKENCAEARRLFQRMLDDPDAPSALKYEAAVMLDQASESEARIADVEAKIEEFKRTAAAPRNRNERAGNKRKS